MKFSPFALRLSVWFLLATLLPLNLFSYFSQQENEALLRQQALEQVSQLADRKLLEIKVYLEGRNRDARILARSSLIAKAMPELAHAFARHGPGSAEYRRLAKKLESDIAPYIGDSRDGLYYDVRLISLQGEIVYSQKREADFASNLISGPYSHTQLADAFRKSIMTLESSYSDLVHYEPSGTPAEFITVPVIRDRTVEGVIALQLDPRQIYQIIVDGTGMGATGETALIRLTVDNEAIFAAPLRSDPQATSRRAMNMKLVAAPVRNALSGQRGSGVDLDYDGKQAATAWRYLPELGWGLVVKMDASEAFAPVYQQRKNLLQMLVLLLLLVSLAALYAGQKLVWRIREFAQKADEIAGGKLDGRVNDSGRDEIGALALSFNRMTDRLQTLYRTQEECIAERTHELNASNDQLRKEISEREKYEQALQLYKSVIDVGRDGFWIVDARGNLQMVNQAAVNISGYSMEEMVLMHISEMDVIEKSVDDVKAHIMKIVAKGHDHFETRHRHKDGHEIDIEVTTTYLPETRQFAAFIRDISGRKQAQMELQHKQDLLNEAQRLGQLGSWELDPASGKMTWSDETYRIFELNPSQLLPFYESFLGAIYPDDRDRISQTHAQSLERRQPYDIVYRLRMADGRIKWVCGHCKTYFDTSGKPLRSVGVIQDITAQKLAEDRLRIAAVAFETHEAILVTDAQSNIIRVNQAFTQITGYQPEEVLGKNPRILSSGRMDMAFYARMWKELLGNGLWSGEIWDKRKSGEIYPKWLTITAVRNEEGDITEFVAMFSDITARKQAEEEIRNLAFYDVLTGLPNRRLLLDRFHLALPASERSQHYGAVLFLDMDKFKTLNDTLGHDYGDLLLLEVAKRIQSCVRETDTVARIGGDEFVVLIEEISVYQESALQTVAVVAEKIRLALSCPYQLKEHGYHSSPSIGVCMFQGMRESVDELLKHADLAMYQAKEAGRNAVQFFDPVMQQVVEARAMLEKDLRHAIASNELSLYYQIQVDSDIRPVGAEALLRWRHPVRGMISPVQFIPVAEDSTLILEIGQWVLDSACRQLAAWGRQDQMRDLELAINVSARQFGQHGFVQQVENAIRRHGISPGCLKLELTESVVLKEVADVVTKMHALKALGIKLSLDDFGTGYSSLVYLKKLPLDQIKIDQSFVRDATSDPNDAAMIKVIIDLAQNFRLNVIAEGVETAAQLTFLRQNGCMAYQGYLFGRPVTAKEFEKVIRGLYEEDRNE